MQVLTSSQPLGPATVQVTYEFFPGTAPDPATYWEPGDPGDAADVAIISASINGEEVDSECFSDEVIDGWQAAILAEHEDDGSTDGPDIDNERESTAECAWEARA